VGSVNDKQEIIKSTRQAFEKWNRTRYHNRTISGDELAWQAWQAAILNDRKEQLAELEPEDYQAASPKHWLRKEVSALKKSLGGGK
jgi:hypothetical protein